MAITYVVVITPLPRQCISSHWTQFDMVFMVFWLQNNKQRAVAWILTRSGLRYHGMLIYNKLPHEITCIMKFKKMIVKFLLEKSFLFCIHDYLSVIYKKFLMMWFLYKQANYILSTSFNIICTVISWHVHYHSVMIYRMKINIKNK